MKDGLSDSRPQTPQSVTSHAYWIRLAEQYSNIHLDHVHSIRGGVESCQAVPRIPEGELKFGEGETTYFKAWTVLVEPSISRDLRAGAWERGGENCENRVIRRRTRYNNLCEIVRFQAFCVRFTGVERERNLTGGKAELSVPMNQRRQTSISIMSTRSVVAYRLVRLMSW